MNYFKDKKFAKFFGERLQSAAKKSNPSLTPMGTDYNRAQQKVNAMQGRNNAPSQGVRGNVYGTKIQQATRNRNKEQRHRLGSKATPFQKKMFGGNDE